MMECRPRCGACCIAPSIRLMPGMPGGKPAGVPCVHLDAKMRCLLFGKPERPDFCATLSPTHEMCGANRDGALEYLSRLESLTRPDGESPCPN